MSCHSCVHVHVHMTCMQTCPVMSCINITSSTCLREKVMVVTKWSHFVSLFYQGSRSAVVQVAVRAAQ